MPETNPLNTLELYPGRELILLDFDSENGTVLTVNEDLGPYSSDLTFKYSNIRDPLQEFWYGLETICVVGCCGVGAFDFAPEAIVDVIKYLDIQTIIWQLERINEQVLASDADIICYNRFNWLFARVTFLELMDYLLTEVKQWV